VGAGWCFRQGGFGALSDRSECCRIAHGEICQVLAVDGDARNIQPVDETAVSGAVLASSSIDALDPQAPELTLAGPAIAERVLPAVHDLLVGGPE